MRGRHGQIWTLALSSAKKLSPVFSHLVFPIFLYAVVHMIPPLRDVGIAADACQRPIVPGVVMDGRHGQVLGGCRSYTQNSLKFPQSHIGIAHFIARK